MVDNKNIKCYLNNDIKNNVLQWMQIKNLSNNDILFNIPYIDKFEKHSINNFKDAIYKTPCTIEGSWDDQIENLIYYLYDKCKNLICNIPVQLHQQFYIDLTKSEITNTQLYFLNKLSNIGDIEITEKEVKFTPFIKNYVNNNDINTKSSSIIKITSSKDDINHFILS